MPEEKPIVTLRGKTSMDAPFCAAACANAVFNLCTPLDCSSFERRRLHRWLPSCLNPFRVSDFCECAYGGDASPQGIVIGRSPRGSSACGSRNLSASPGVEHTVAGTASSQIWTSTVSSSALCGISESSGSNAEGSGPSRRSPSDFVGTLSSPLLRQCRTKTRPSNGIHATHL